MAKTTIDTAHAEIARVIRLAKKRMFKAHREGEPLTNAATGFIDEVGSIIAEQSLRLGIADISKGTASASVTNVTPNASAQRNDLADAVATIIHSDLAPPRLRDAVVDYITDAPIGAK